MEMITIIGCAGILALGLASLLFFFGLSYLYCISPPLAIVITIGMVFAYIFWKYKEKNEIMIKKNNLIQNEQEILIDKNDELNSLLNTVNYNLHSKKYIAKTLDSGIILNEDKFFIIYSDDIDINNENPKTEIRLAEYKYQDILDLEVFNNSRIIFQKPEESLSQEEKGLLWTTAGGLIGGVPGAAVGSLATSTKIKNELIIGLRITVSDIINPIYIINFYNEESSNQEPREQAMHWHGVLKAMIKKTNQQIETKEQKALQTNSIADELTKLSSLLNKGIITQEEFDKQKNKLLN